MSTRAAADIDRYVTRLGRALRGPRRVKRSLLDEARGGLDDAARAYERAGLGPEDARRRAIADFGDVDEVTPGYQAELAAAQSRRTGMAIIAALGLQIVAWDHSWPLLPEPPDVPPGASLTALDAAVEWLGGACLVAAIGLVAGARSGARWPRLDALIGRTTGVLGWVVGAFLVVSALLLNALSPAAGQFPLVSLAVPLLLFVALPVAGLVRSSRRCLALG